MRLFSNNIVPYTSTEGDKIYPIVVDIKKGIKSGEAISFVTADNQVGVITVDFMDGNSSYSIEDCMVTSTIRRPDGTVLEIPCDIISQSTIEIPLGINGTYQEGVHTFDLKLVRGNGKIVGVPTMSYSVSGSLSSDDVVEGDDRLPVLTMVLDNAQDKLTRLDKAIAGATNDLEVKEARDGEVTLNARLERDLVNTNRELEKIKKLEESTVTTVTTDSSFTTVAETTQGYFEDVKLEGKTLVNLAGSVNDYFNQFAVVARTCMLLKCNTEYTAVISNKVDHLVRVYGNEGSILATPTFDIPAKTTIIKKLHTKDVVDDTGLFKSNSTTGTLFKLDILLLEGDHTDKDISFFEGLKSVGQDTDISISSVNENLLMPFHTGSPIGFSNLNAISFSSDHSISYKATAWGQGVKVHVSGVSKGEKYLLLFDSNLNGVIRGYGGLETGRDISCHDNKIEITAVSSGDAHIVFKNTSEVCDVSYTNARLVKKSSIDPNYKLHKQDKKQLLYYNPTTQTWEKPILREWDSIEKHSNGKYYYHKRSGEVVLNGSENWTLHASVYTNHCQFALSVKGWVWNHILLCDKFQSTVYEIEIDAEKIIIGGSDNVHIRISKSKAQDVEGFKKWLQANPTTVVYELAQEEVYECTNLDLITYGGETNLIVNSGAIQPKLELKVLSNVSNVVKLLQEKVSILENKFIRGLQQVLAGDMLSLAHLLYPEDFEHEIQTLEL